jgi:hypothetical protein
MGGTGNRNEVEIASVFVSKQLKFGGQLRGPPYATL